MSIASQVKNAITSVSNPANWFAELIGGNTTNSGQRVNGQTALSISTVWQAINVISGDVGQLPLQRFKRLEDDSRERSKDPVMEIKPNRMMTPIKLKETLQAHALVYGNGYAAIKRNPDGSVRSLTVLIPTTVTLFFNSQNNLRYRVTTNRGDETYIKEFKDTEILHIRGLGYDGQQGYSVVSLAAESMGIAKAAEKHGANYFKNFATPQGLLKMPGNMPKPEAIEQTKRDWKTLQSGDNDHDIAVMYGGMEFQPLAFTNKDSQFLESREFQRTEIASWFNLPPHKVGDLSRATFTNIEEQNRDYLTTSLMYWLVTWQEECTDKLLSDAQKKRGYYYEFNTAALLRGDTQSRFNSYASGINNGWLSRNEARKMENLDSIDGLDEYLLPLNMTRSEPDGDETKAVLRDEKYIKEIEYEIIEAAVSGIVRMEGNRIASSAKTTKNFTEMVDKFYAQFSDKLWEVIEPMGATVETLDKYTRSSKTEWMIVVENYKDRADLIASRVEARSESWDYRTKYLTESIIKDRKNEQTKTTVAAT